jgi:sulfate/thiosulfate transport system permease protein
MTHLGRHALRGAAIAFLLLVVALPVGTLFHAAFAEGLGPLVTALGSRTALHALWLTLWTAVVVTFFNALFGTMTAWVLVRYRFVGRALLSAVIDLPFAVPTVVSGMMLVILYGPRGAVGGWLLSHGVKVLFQPLGILLALAFVTFPLVVRAVEPVLAEIDRDQEEAAFTLGAWPYHSFRHVVLPAIAPAVATGALLSFARALGEFGTVVLVAGNLPRRTLTAPVFVYGAIESGEPRAAAAMSALLVLVSVALILLVDRFSGERRLQTAGGSA